MSAPLTSLQKQRLAWLSQRAYNLTASLKRGEGQAFNLTPEEWRHEQVAAACGKAGLRCCSQDDFNLVKAHFHELLGDSGKAFNCFVRGATEARRVAEYKVLEACRQFGLRLAYADKICRAQNHGAGLDDVDAKALWHLVFTLRNRGRAKARSHQQQQAA